MISSKIEMISLKKKPRVALKTIPGWNKKD
jgi:hypothetical protein